MYDIGYSYRNSRSSGWCNWCIVVVQEIGALCNVSLKCVSSLERNIGLQRYAMVTR